MSVVAFVGTPSLRVTEMGRWDWRSRTPRIGTLGVVNIVA